MAPAIHEPESIPTRYLPNPSVLKVNRHHAAIQDIIRDFLRRSAYEPHSTPPNAQLRAAVSDTMLAWQTDDSVEVIHMLVDASCSFAETAYSHLDYDHLLYVAFYTAMFLYIDDVGGKYLTAVREFASRVIHGKSQLSPALDTLAVLMRQAHAMWSDVGADAIISGTMDAVNGMYIEYTTQDMDIKPQATEYPYYLRYRSGICPPYIHFLFMKSWRPSTESYLQMLPYMERWIVGVNDLLSFYKEELAGERRNYMHMRADAEQVPVIEVLRTLANELVDCNKTVEKLAGDDCELASVWSQYVQRAMEFHVNTRRYRLLELTL
ncbi:terpenoid synthase [Daedaleopsis nitida]|nr:terpenoid synthase [Daedaleopsis nitida]